MDFKGYNYMLNVVCYYFPNLYNNLMHIHIICTAYIRDILDTSFIKPSLFLIINFEDPVEGYNYSTFYIDFTITIIILQVMVRLSVYAMIY